MKFSLELAKEDDFPELITAQWETFDNPPQGIFRLFFPIEDGDWEKSLHRSIEDQRTSFIKEQPTVKWIKVMDVEKKRIAAAAKWYFFDNASSLAKRPPVEVDWYPKGVIRNFVTQAVQQYEQPRHEMGQGPHAYLHIGFTRPKYQKQGLGSKWMEWGLAEADRLGLETRLDSTDSGVPLYEKYNFQVAKVHELSPVMPASLTSNEMREWKRCEEEFLPIRTTVMVRFPGGVPAASMEVQGSRWFRCYEAYGPVLELVSDRPEALKKIKQLCEEPDKLDEWEEAQFPAPVEYEPQIVTDWYDLHTVREASSLSAAGLREDLKELPTHAPEEIMNNGLAQPPLEPLHLRLDIPTFLNELQARLFIDLMWAWRWHVCDPITMRYDSPALNYFCITILRLAAWDFEVSFDTDVDLPVTDYPDVPWSCPKGDIYWFHGFLVVLHNNLEDHSMVRSAVQKAEQYLKKTASQNHHTRLIIISTCQVVFAEISDDTVRASSPSMLISDMSSGRWPAGFRALCQILTTNCWRESKTHRETWKPRLPAEIIQLILQHLEPRDTRSGLEESGVMCSVCCSWQHSDCLDQANLPSDSCPHYICSRCRSGEPEFLMGREAMYKFRRKGACKVRHEVTLKRFWLQQNQHVSSKMHESKHCLADIDYTVRFNGAFSGLAYGFDDRDLDDDGTDADGYNADGYDYYSYDDVSYDDSGYEYEDYDDDDAGNHDTDHNEFDDEP
ncbi:hypothetical protein AtubIFM56815_000037 [Aspergillus tubingensis]|uniref:N-acetyltransferase domain-containing protein n=1 Tax=Aspergillus tubingensis TaxID=5068 RepID=A0A9W6AGU7_ASPTU|nr:hypothetical protein AtubIFM56815_000037 [Aspergillus tubingensis]